jgi:hypothetical protein
MPVLAALGDAPTAAISVVAIALGVLFAARGPRDKRAAGDGETDERAPMMVSMPASAAPDPEPEAEPGFVGPEGEVVGHGPIRLGLSAAVGTGESAAPDPAPAPEPVGEAPDPAPEAPSEPHDPAWRVAARAANSAVHFRQGTIKIGGKPVDKRDGP